MESNVKNFSVYLEKMNAARDYLFNLKDINKNDINKIYLIASDNENLIESGNENILNISLFRNKEFLFLIEKLNTKVSF